MGTSLKPCRPKQPLKSVTGRWFAFIALTGIRDGAAISLRLKHVDLMGPTPRVIQNPNQVSTKNSKRIDTFFFPIGEPFEALVLEWINFLKDNLR